MDFGALPPEVNSARMYAGPGSAPLLAAAANWSAMATELHYSATSYAAAIADLADSAWQGPSAASMTAAAAPYAAWLKATAVGAEETALQASAAAGAYEAAYAATVPPPVIAANRALLGTLVATNFLGQNAPAIAATEAQYGEMWAQDAAAMYTYAGTSATASQLTPFSTPPETTNGSGQISQPAAASSADSSLSDFLSKIPNALQNMLNMTPTQIVDDYQAVIKTLTNVISTANGPYGINIESSARSIYQMAISIPSVANGLGNLTSTLNPKPIVGALSPLLASPLLTGAQAVPASAVSGAVGRAGLIGSLSVPSTWASAVPAVKTATVALQASVLEAVPALAVNGEGVLAGQMALSSLAGRAIGTPIRQAAGATATRAISAISHVTNTQTGPDIATIATVIVIPPIAK
ncbi:PPE family protein [Mycolicibacterium mageritense]|uniref:PPE family protein n=1 Tax=Mycolicibacterium mageritense TaxID=53462 RepID=UPI0011DAF5F4|nr:PPE family protein [Mycolicibacterium mageritense]TXI62890.1 MAG: PPE family protein [Mycolicibacterium mageritense]